MSKHAYSKVVKGCGDPTIGGPLGDGQGAWDTSFDTKQCQSAWRNASDAVVRASYTQCRARTTQQRSQQHSHRGCLDLCSDGLTGCKSESCVPAQGDFMIYDYCKKTRHLLMSPSKKMLCHLFQRTHVILRVFSDDTCYGMASRWRCCHRAAGSGAVNAGSERDHHHRTPQCTEPTATAPGTTGITQSAGDRTDHLQAVRDGAAFGAGATVRTPAGCRGGAAAGAGGTPHRSRLPGCMAVPTDRMVTAQSKGSERQCKAVKTQNGSTGLPQAQAVKGSENTQAEAVKRQ